jgi:protein SCO1/2
MAGCKLIFGVVAALLLGSAAVARAQYGIGNYGPGVAAPANLAAITAKPNAQIPLDLSFTNSDGQIVKLRQLFAGKPVILTMVYFSCPRLCDYTQAGLAGALMDGPRNLRLGQDYNVIVVSIDPDEKPGAAAAKRQTYLGKMDKPASQPGFYYLTGDAASIRELASTIGFGYQRNPEGADKFFHAAGIFICTPDGRLSQTIEGVSFDPDTVHYRLVQASSGRISTGLLGFALSCGAMRYNPVTGMYEHNRWFWAGTGGALLTVIVVGTFLAVLWRGEYKRAKHGGGPAVHAG